MHRRTFVVASASLASAPLSGCLDGEEPAPDPQISFLEIENHRHDEPHEFDVRIEESGEVVFETNEELVGDPTAGVELYENPVSGPGEYEITVEVDEYDATVRTAELISPEADCLYLNFYLGGTLHFEYLSWPCENAE